MWNRKDEESSAIRWRWVQKDNKNKFHGWVVSFKGCCEKNEGSSDRRLHYILDFDNWCWERALSRICCLWFMFGWTSSVGQGKLFGNSPVALWILCFASKLFQRKKKVLPPSYITNWVVISLNNTNKLLVLDLGAPSWLLISLYAKALTYLLSYQSMGLEMYKLGFVKSFSNYIISLVFYITFTCFSDYAELQG